MDINWAFWRDLCEWWLTICSGLVIQKHRQLLPIKLGVAGPRVEGGRLPFAADKVEGTGRDWVKRHFELPCL
jgi:hypothetical protein